MTGTTTALMTATFITMILSSCIIVMLVHATPSSTTTKCTACTFSGGSNHCWKNTVVWKPDDHSFLLLRRRPSYHGRKSDIFHLLRGGDDGSGEEEESLLTSQEEELNNNEQKEERSIGVEDHGSNDKDDLYDYDDDDDDNSEVEEKNTNEEENEMLDNYVNKFVAGNDLEGIEDEESEENEEDFSTSLSSSKIDNDDDEDSDVDAYNNDEDKEEKKGDEEDEEEDEEEEEQVFALQSQKMMKPKSKIKLKASMPQKPTSKLHNTDTDTPALTSSSPKITGPHKQHNQHLWQEQRPPPPPPNTIHKFLLRKFGIIGRILVVFSILIDEFTYSYLPEFHSVALIFFKKLFEFVPSNDQNHHVPSHPTRRHSLSKRKKTASDRKKQRDKDALIKIKRVESHMDELTEKHGGGGKYAHLSLAFMTRYGLGEKIKRERNVYEKIIAPLIVDEDEDSGNVISEDEKGDENENVMNRKKARKHKKKQKPFDVWSVNWMKEEGTNIGSTMLNDDWVFRALSEGSKQWKEHDEQHDDLFLTSYEDDYGSHDVNMEEEEDLSSSVTIGIKSFSNTILTGVGKSKKNGKKVSLQEVAAASRMESNFPKIISSEKNNKESLLSSFGEEESENDQWKEEEENLEVRQRSCQMDNFAEKSLSNIGGGVWDRLKAVGSATNLPTRILGAYPGDAVPIEEAGNAKGVEELAFRYGYGDWSDDEEDNNGWDSTGSRRSRKRRKRRKHSSSSMKALDNIDMGMGMGMDDNGKIQMTNRGSSRRGERRSNGSSNKQRRRRGSGSPNNGLQQTFSISFDVGTSSSSVGIGSSRHSMRSSSRRRRHTNTLYPTSTTTTTKQRFTTSKEDVNNIIESSIRSSSSRHQSCKNNTGKGDGLRLPMERTMEVSSTTTCHNIHPRHRGSGTSSKLSTIDMLAPMKRTEVIFTKKKDGKN